jgi:hypothetical protein
MWFGGMGRYQCTCESCKLVPSKQVNLSFLFPLGAYPPSVYSSSAVVTAQTPHIRRNNALSVLNDLTANVNLASQTLLKIRTEARFSD